MQQTSKTPRLPARPLRWGVLALVVAALLIFAGAALAQEIQPQTATPQTATPAVEQVKPDPGLVVVYVVADGPAAAAGVARGDIILAVDDDAVNTLAELMHVVNSHDPGAVIVLNVTHGDEERSLSVTLGDNNGRPELGLMAVGDMAVEKRMEDQRGPKGFDLPGRGGRQGRMPALPFGRGQMPDMPFGQGAVPGMPFGRGAGMLWMQAGGALVVGVMEEGAAASAGIQAGDVITALNDVAVTSSDELVALLGDHKPGDVVTVTYARDDATASAEVTLGAHPDDEAKAYLGVQLAPADPTPFAREMGQGMLPFMPGQEILSGVHLIAVTEDGPAAAAGLKAGDWITAVNGEAISDPQELVDAVKAAAPGDEMALTVQGVDDEEATDVTVVLGENDEGGALLGVQIGGAMRIQRGPGGMNFDFRQFRGQDGDDMPFFHWRSDGEGQQGMPQMPFFFGRPGQEDGGRFEFRVPQFRFQTPESGDDVLVPNVPGYVTEGA